jgi:2,4-dienoyl-CoA reductase-like NADH-dependent reductase (Old Yellow Enzyme family)
MSLATKSLSSPLKLADTNEIKNRFVKGACREGLANPMHDPTPQLDQLYRRWSAGGAGVVISSTVWVNRSDNVPSGDLVLDDESDMVAYRRLAKAGQSNHSQCWLQLGYLSASSDATINDLSSGGMMGIIQTFVQASRRAELAGFAGVQIAAHSGHFLGDSLDGDLNCRSDAWGGDNGRRAALVFAILTAIRKSVQANFSVNLTLDAAALEREVGDRESNQAFIQLLDQQLDSLQLTGELKVESLAEQFAATAIIGSGDTFVSRQDAQLTVAATFDLVAFDHRCVLMPDLPEKMFANPQFKWPSAWPAVESGAAKISTQLADWYQHQMYLLSMGESSYPVAGRFSLGLRVRLLRWRSERSQRRLFGYR